MDTIKYKLSLNLQRPGVQHTIYAKQGDALTREIEFTLNDGESVYRLADGLRAFLYAKAGEATVFTECMIDGDKIIAEITSNMLAAKEIKAELRLTNKDGAVLTTPKIRIISECSVYSDDAVTASNEFSALLSAIQAAENSRIVSITADVGCVVITYADGRTVRCEVDTVPGVGVESIKQTVSSAEDGGENVVTVTLTNGQTSSFTVKNGSKGNAFSYDDFTDEQLALLKGERGYSGIYIGSGEMPEGYNAQIDPDAEGDEIITAEQLEEAVGAALAEAKAGGEFDGEDGVSVTHKWNGTVLEVTSASGTSSADLKGEKGDQGIQGVQGEKGDDGAKGEKGADGTSVAVESVSESAEDGGSNVVTFSDGKTLTVKNGSKGSTGAQGEKGDTGDTGAQGPQGVKGDTGPQGPQGVKGDTGPQGPQGVKGDTGAQGVQGEAGYTPQKGVDYYTEADKSEMVNAVLAALPTWEGGSY